MTTNTLNYQNILLPLGAAPQYWLAASTSGQTIVGNSGDDAIYGVGGDTLIGGTGDDTFYVSSSDQVIVAPGGGVDTIVTYWGGYTLPANVQNLIVQGNGAYGVGNSLDNVIEAVGPGKITLDGGGGNNVLIGGTGETDFVHSVSDSNDVIDNFVPGLDKVRLENTDLFTFAALQSQMQQVGSDVLLKLGASDSITFRNLQVGQFSPQDFMLPLDYSKLHMSFDDEFNSLSLWNGTSGTWSTSYWWAQPNGVTLPSNGELEWYINSNYAPTASVKPWTVNNGILSLTAAPAAASIQPLINNYQYTSGMLTTHDSFVQTYGVYEIRAKVPAGQGLWEDFWLLPENGSWPPELDVLEINGGNPKSLLTAMGSDSGGQRTSAATSTPIPDASAGFHTYTVDWEPDTITWYFDGNEVFQTATPADMKQPMYMLVNLAVGGAYGNPNSSTQFPANLQVDYVRVYATTAAPPVISKVSPATTSNQLTLTGTAEGDSTVNIYEDGALIRTAAANGVGAWSFAAGVPPNGSHNFTATDTNAANNTSTSSSALTVSVSVIQTDVSTSLTEVANQYFYLEASGGLGTALKYSGAAVTVGEFGGWTPIGAIQTASGYDVAWKNTTGQYTVWTTDSNGNRTGSATGGAVSGTSYALESFEPVFGQDLNADGIVGPTVTVIQTDGSTSLTEVANLYFYLDGNAETGPSLKYGGTNVTAGEFGGWIPIGAIQTASGYDVAWKNTSTGQYTVWTTDNNGNRTGSASGGAASGTSYALESLEPVFHQDLNGDGIVGPTVTVIQTDGSTSLTEIANLYFYLDGSGGTGPALKYGGTNVTAGEFGSWTPIGAIQTASGYDVAWKNTSTGQYTVWTTDSNGNRTGNATGGAVSGTSYALESFEPVFRQDLNCDGVVGLYAAPGTTLQLSTSLTGPMGVATIGAGATLDVVGSDSSNVTFQSSTGTLRLDHSSTFSGEILSFTGTGMLSSSDQIDLRDVKYSSANTSYASGVLTVADGLSDTAKLAFSGSYTLATFKLASDGSGGTIVYDPPITQTSQQAGGPEDAAVLPEAFQSRAALFANFIASSFVAPGANAAILPTQQPSSEPPLLLSPRHS
jgi:beta-glucanase (GH16 family)